MDKFNKPLLLATAFLIVIVIAFLGYLKYSKNLDLNNKKMCGEQKQKLEKQFEEYNKFSGIHFSLIEMFYSSKKNTCISVEQSKSGIFADYFVQDYFTGETLDSAKDKNEILEIIKKYKD